MSVEDLVRADLARLPEDLRDSGLAAGVLAMARELDLDNSATSKSMCFRAMREGLRDLHELAPPEQETDGLDDIAAQRAKRIARRSASQD